MSKSVENALVQLEKKVPIGLAIARSARDFDRSPREIWTALRQESAYRFWLTQQQMTTLEEIDLWSDSVAGIVLSSSSDQEIDSRILALGPKG